MKKALFMVFALLLISCKHTTTKTPEQNGQRFQVIYEQIDGADNGYQIIYDTKANKKISILQERLGWWINKVKRK